MSNFPCPMQVVLQLYIYIYFFFLLNENRLWWGKPTNIISPPSLFSGRCFFFSKIYPTPSIILKIYIILRWPCQLISLRPILIHFFYTGCPPSPLNIQRGASVYFYKYLQIFTGTWDKIWYCVKFDLLFTYLLFLWFWAYTCLIFHVPCKYELCLHV